MEMTCWGVDLLIIEVEYLFKVLKQNNYIRLIA